MKTTKKNCAWFVVLTALLSAMIFMGCGGGTDNENTSRTTGGDGMQEGLSAKTEKRIKQDIIDYNRKHNISFDVSFDDMYLEYCGTYNGCIAVFLQKYKPSIFSITTDQAIFDGNVIIDGIEFFFPFPYQIYVWKAGKIYTLQEAYDLELFTRDNLISIRYYPVVSSDKKGEDLFSSQSRRLDEGMEKTIFQVLKTYLNNELGISISVVHCYDICSCYVVLEHEYRDDTLSGDLRYITIDGLEFTVTQTGGIYTWKLGRNILTLEEAYDGELLTRKDLENIHSYNRLRYEGGEK